MITDKAIRYWDLDGTMMQTIAKWWILDKRDPGKPMLRISQYEGSLILAGFHINDGHQLSYNGLTGWISDEHWQKINRIRKIKHEDIGLSFREFEDFDHIQEQALSLIVHTDRMTSLKDTVDTMHILTARGNKQAHQIILTKLDESLAELGITIEQAHFVNDAATAKFQGDSALRKALHIIETIVGYEIKDNAFVPLQVDAYKESHFYDDEDKNISQCEKINDLISGLFANTAVWLRDEIVDSLKTQERVLYIHQVTTNELNPFQTIEIKIKI